MVSVSIPKSTFVLTSYSLYRVDDKVCSICGRPFVKGEKVIGRNKSFNKKGRNSPNDKVRVYYHESCWYSRYLEV